MTDTLVALSMRQREAGPLPSFSFVILPYERADGSRLRFGNQPVILVNKAHVFQPLQYQPLTLLGQTPNFFMGHSFQEVSNGLGDPDCYHFSFLFHVKDYRCMKKAVNTRIKTIFTICIHLTIMKMIVAKYQGAKDRQLKERG